MFSSRLSLRVLADWLRSLASTLGSGLSVVDAFRISGRRSRPPVGPLSKKIEERLRDGDDLVAALESVGDVFPPLALSMFAVASRTGHLPEVVKELEKYYRFQLRLRRQFLGQIFWPVFQLVAAILVIALVIFIMGIIAESRPQEETIDLLGLGLSGGSGAIIWLVGCFGSFAMIWVSYLLARRVFGQAVVIDRILLKIPVLGPCLKMLALSRLCFAMNVTLDSGMSVLEAIRLSLEATDNGAFTSLVDYMDQKLREGESLHDVFEEHSVFPPEFLEVLHSAQESGTIPEAMLRLSSQYNEQAEHQLGMLNTAAGWLVWLLVATIIVFFIFRVFMTYVSMLNQAIDMT